MPLVTLPAHFDGKNICLDEPYSLSPNVKLMVVVLSEKQEMPETSRVQLGDLPEIFTSLPHLSEVEQSDFTKDIHHIRTQFEGEELKDPWESCYRHSYT